MNDREALVRALRRIHGQMMHHDWNCGCAPKLLTLHRHHDKPGFEAREVPVPRAAWREADWNPQILLQAITPVQVLPRGRSYVGVALSMEAWSVMWDVNNPKTHDRMMRFARMRMLGNHPQRKSVRNTIGVITDGTALHLMQHEGEDEPQMSWFDRAVERAESGVYHQLARLNDRLAVMVEDAQ